MPDFWISPLPLTSVPDNPSATQICDTVLSSKSYHVPLLLCFGQLVALDISFQQLNLHVCVNTLVTETIVLEICSVNTHCLGNQLLI